MEVVFDIYTITESYNQGNSLSKQRSDVSHSVFMQFFNEN